MQPSFGACVNTRHEKDAAPLAVAAAYGFHEHGDPATRLLFSPR